MVIYLVLVVVCCCSLLIQGKTSIPSNKENNEVKYHIISFGHRYDNLHKLIFLVLLFD